MKNFLILLLGAVAPSMPLFSQEMKDSLNMANEKEWDLNEVVVTTKRPPLKQEPDRIVYLIRNDPYL